MDFCNEFIWLVCNQFQLMSLYGWGIESLQCSTDEFIRNAPLFSLHCIFAIHIDEFLQWIFAMDLYIAEEATG